MADIEKVIKGLEHCTSYGSTCDQCDYWEHNRNEDDPHCGDVLMRDALELLKEYQKTVHCKDCKWSWCLNPNDESPFYVCRHPTLCNMRMSHEGNWYCGDGELKDGEQE